jgi:outer membrane immunogenic protein
MQKLLIGVIAAFLGAIAPAYAADLKGNGDPTGAEYTNYRAAFQGLSAGIGIGGEFVNIDILDQFDGIGADGLVGQVHADYLFAAGSFRVGPYVEGGISNVNTEINGQDLLNQDYFFGGGLQIGYVVWNSTMLYVQGGGQWSKWDIAEGAADADVFSVKLGGGVDTMVADHVSLGLNLAYVTPIDIEVDGTDLTDFLEESEGFVGLLRLSYRQ